MDPLKKRAEVPGDPAHLDDLKNPLVAEHLLGALPKRLIEVNGHPVPAPEDAPRQPEVRTREEIVEQVMKRLRDGLLRNPAAVPAALGQAIDLAFLQNDIDQEAVRVALPFNAAQVRAGGFAVLNACMGVEEAKPMKVDAEALGRDLARCERIRQLRAVIDPAYQVLDANESQVLNRVAEQVQEGLGRGWSVIQNNGALLRTLEPALAIRGRPALDAQQTRADHARREGAIRADEQARLKAEQPVDPLRPQTLTTVTTHAAPPPMAPAPKAAPGAPAKRPGA